MLYLSPDSCRASSVTTMVSVKSWSPWRLRLILNSERRKARVRLCCRHHRELLWKQSSPSRRTTSNLFFSSSKLKKKSKYVCHIFLFVCFVFFIYIFSPYHIHCSIFWLIPTYTVLKPVYLQMLTRHFSVFQALSVQNNELRDAQIKANNRVSNHKQATQLLQTELQDSRAQVEEKENTIQTLTKKLRESEVRLKI